jgi:hypothetical protein
MITLCLCKYICLVGSGCTYTPSTYNDRLFTGGYIFTRECKKTTGTTTTTHIHTGTTTTTD